MIDQAHSLRQEATRKGMTQLASDLEDAIKMYENKKLHALTFREMIRNAEEALR